ncbi:MULTISPECIES: M15 family metallopeptidase [Nocardiopsis]|uniref:D-alanyl-D-alanine carboxypeptidase family protein n=2 Tax=Nocardiopsis alba TaxID=53437 RepID=A0A7K2IR63_9ACTN|nr:MULTISPECIES: M15 family metallopeptidase [Nocardiopsis]AFR05779.1 D-alanyl-D-alanine carboxypeptidase family protein [Nocardiopsis alba ATCC BAA-2165]MEC3892787.1 D-alanyl-D-alanine carboxypeptidase family protein [Nocardiopsis sp. LDBS1602]MYR32294.1 peptidase M15 [Nocardiopsis alba]
MPFTSDSARRRSRAPGTGALGALGTLQRVRMTQALTLVLLTALLVVPLPESGLEPASAQSSLEELRNNAEEASKELEKATDEYVERQEELEKAQEELVDTLHELQRIEVDLGEMREPLAQLASTMYQQPEAGVLGILAAGDLDEDLQTQSYAAKLSEDNQALIQDATDLREEQIGLAGEAQDLQTFTQLEQAELAAKVDDLRAQSEESTNALTDELESRGLDPDTFMAAADCDPSAASKADGYPNGLLPKEALCELYDGHSLRADAAKAFLELNMEHVEQFGENICITSSYRDLPNQHRVYGEVPPGFAAVPGTSNHGLGQAIDLGCGIQNFRSDKWNWMETNGGRYGWIHPAWAKSNPFEPWHWEFEG